MAYFEIADGHIAADEGGRKSLDTRAPMLFRVPTGAITLTGYSISFPDLWKGTLYHQYRQSAFPLGDTHGCSTWIGLVEQEWGPSEAAPNTLADITLGSLPAGTNRMEIWVNLTRTVSPSNMLDLALQSNFPEGQWVKLDGYSCVVEEFMGVARQFEFVLDGTTVKLRRTQSVNKDGGVVSPPGPRVTGGAVLGNKVFFFPGTNAPEASGKLTVYGRQIDSKVTQNDGGTHRPDGYQGGSANNNPCSMSHAGISYASTWTGSITITPAGYID